MLALPVLVLGGRWLAKGLPPFLDAGRGQWSVSLYRGASPFALAPSGEVPLLTAADVADRPSWFVADPFLHRHGDGWYLFYESLTREGFQGDIGVAESRDGTGFRHRGIVLDEPWHLSYPLVFEAEGHVWMLPESFQKQAIRLYRAERFPDRWRFHATLVEGREYLDPTIFRHRDRWWLFASLPSNDTLFLFSAPGLEGPWEEHPMSPVIAGDRGGARPGGRILEHQGRLYRFGQDDRGVYGRALRIFEILELDPHRYRERAVDPDPWLSASGSGWNQLGMHHADILPDPGGGYVAAVDGRGEYLRFGLRFW